MKLEVGCALEVCQNSEAIDKAERTKDGVVDSLRVVNSKLQ